MTYSTIQEQPVVQPRKRTGRIITLLILALASIAALAAYGAPRYLVYADKPGQADAVVLFVGPDVARQKEANRLLEEGNARFLIVPAFNQVFKRGNIPVPVKAAGNLVSGKGRQYPDFYEKTHAEALIAKKIMDAMGLKTAIMVSSPYHMRRIRMIAGAVFGEQSRLFSYVPGSSGRNPVALHELRRADWKFVISEYVKICWFRLYAPFIGTRSFPALA